METFINPKQLNTHTLPSIRTNHHPIWQRPLERRNSSDSISTDVTGSGLHLTYRDDSNYDKNQAMLEQGIEESRMQQEHEEQIRNAEANELRRAIAQSRSYHPSFTPIPRNERAALVLESSRKKLETSGRKLPVRKRSLSVGSPLVLSPRSDLAASERAWIESKMEKGIIGGGLRLPPGAMGISRDQEIEEKMLEMAIQLSLEQEQNVPLQNSNSPSRPPLPPRRAPPLPPRSPPLAFIPPSRPKIFTAARCDSPVDQPFLSSLSPIPVDSPSRFTEDLNGAEVNDSRAETELAVRNGIEISPISPTETMHELPNQEELIRSLEAELEITETTTFEPEIISVGASAELQAKVVEEEEERRDSVVSSRFEPSIRYGFEALEGMGSQEFPKLITLSLEENKSSWNLEGSSYVSILRFLMWHSNSIITSGIDSEDIFTKLTFLEESPRVRLTFTLAEFPLVPFTSNGEIHLLETEKGKGREENLESVEKSFLISDIFLPAPFSQIATSLYSLRYLASIAASTTPTSNATEAYLALRELGISLSAIPTTVKPTRTDSIEADRLVDRMKERLTRWKTGSARNKLIKLPSEELAKGVRVDRSVRVLSSDEDRGEQNSLHGSTRTERELRFLPRLGFL